ncbi:HU family DNA-binding protein [Gammaproteobacteria bacterium]|nr:HU family DNA-binding protein [Gammaproteobacteria bacterium]
MAAKKKVSAKAAKTSKSTKTAKKVTKKVAKKVAKKTVNKVKLPVVKEALTKSGIVKAVMEMTGLAKKDAVAVFEALGTVIELHVKSRGPGKFTLPGLFKINVVNKPAKKAREGVNPFTGETVMFKAKPAHKVVKIRALRKLKDMVA